MFLYLIRHGEAKTESEDPERGLTEKGGRHALRMGEFLAFMGTRLDTIVHSPKKRAAETARAIMESIRPAKGFHEEEGLAPNDDPGNWVTKINAMTGDTAIVGHLPFLDRLLGLLVLDDPNKTIVDFRPVTAVCLRPAGDGKWLVVWVLNPEVIW